MSSSSSHTSKFVGSILLSHDLSDNHIPTPIPIEHPNIMNNYGYSITTQGIGTAGSTIDEWRIENEYCGRVYTYPINNRACILVLHRI